MVTENPFERQLPIEGGYQPTNTVDIKNPPRKEVAYKHPAMSTGILSVKQVILGSTPSKSNCYMIITMKGKDGSKGHGSLAKTAALRKYEQDFFIQCNQYRNAGISEYFSIEIDVYYPNQRSDLDNSLKVVLDCLQKVGAISNDNLCTRIVANKFLDKLNPRIEFTISKSQKQ